MSATDPVQAVEDACRVMHDAYEAAAAKEGWETQERSRKPWEDVPEANKATMRVAVSALLDHLAAVRPAIEREVKAAALREAADKAPVSNDGLIGGKDLRNWLRSNADRIEADTVTEREGQAE